MPTPCGGPVVLVCVVVRKGCVSVLTGRVIFGEWFWVKLVGVHTTPWLYDSVSDCERKPVLGAYQPVEAVA